MIYAHDFKQKSGIHCSPLPTVNQPKLELGPASRDACGQNRYPFVGTKKGTLAHREGRTRSLQMP